MTAIAQILSRDVVPSATFTHPAKMAIERALVASASQNSEVLTPRVSAGLSFLFSLIFLISWGVIFCVLVEGFRVVDSGHLGLVVIDPTTRAKNNCEQKRNNDPD